MVKTANEIYREYVTPGVPASGAQKPVKADIREWGTLLENFLVATSANAGTVFETKTQLDANLARVADSMAWVVADTTIENNGIYKKIGASGSGSWSFVSDLPFSYVPAYDNGSSTANAITTYSRLPIGYGPLISVLIPYTNTSSTVTIAFNGSDPFPIKTVSLVDPPVGSLVAGSSILGVLDEDAGIFHLLTDVSSSAIQTAAAASASAAASSASSASASSTLAQKWATEAEDVPVTTGLYSAFHWARKAMAYATGSIADAIHGATAKTIPAALDELAISDSAASWGLKKTKAEALTAGPEGYSYGLALTKNATDATNDIDIAAGVATSDTSPFYRMTLSAMTKRLDATWSSGTGNGGLDTGTVGNNTYYIFVIQNSTTLAVDILFSLSSTAPTMPSGYDRKRLIGSVVRTGGVNGVPQNIGATSHYQSPEITMVSGGAFSFTHGLGVVPRRCDVLLVCKGAEIGYTVGDVVLLNPSFYYDGGVNGIGVALRTNTVEGRVGTGGIGLVNLSNGGSKSYITYSKWGLIVRVSL